MIKPGRIACVNPRCGRSSARKADQGDNAEICCAKCWKLLPARLTARYRALQKRDKLVGKLFRREQRSNPLAAAAGIRSQRMEIVGEQLDRALDSNWRTIHDYFRQPERPAGLENFLKEIGL